MSRYSGLQRFAYQKRATEKYAPDSTEDSSVKGISQERAVMKAVNPRWTARCATLAPLLYLP